MNVPCPTEVELIQFLDGECTRNRSESIADHLRGCARCQEIGDRIRLLTADLAAPIPGLPAGDAVARIMASLDRARPAQASRSRRLWLGLATGGVAAVAAALLVMSARPPVTTYVGVPAVSMQARGGASGASLARDVGVTLYALHDELVALSPGAVLTGDEALTAAYRNRLPHEKPVFLMVFAVDSQHAIHWLYPGFTDSHTDPSAISIPPAGAETPLPESVVLDHPAVGPLRVFVLAAFEPLRVSAIERTSESALTLAGLRALHPGADVRELRLEVAPAAPAGH